MNVVAREVKPCPSFTLQSTHTITSKVTHRESRVEVEDGSGVIEPGVHANPLLSIHRDESILRERVAREYYGAIVDGYAALPLPPPHQRPGENASGAVASRSRTQFSTHHTATVRARECGEGQEREVDIGHVFYRASLVVRGREQLQWDLPSKHFHITINQSKDSTPQGNTLRSPDHSCQ